MESCTRCQRTKGFVLFRNLKVVLLRTHKGGNKVMMGSERFKDHFKDYKVTKGNSITSKSCPKEMMELHRVLRSLSRVMKFEWSFGKPLWKLLWYIVSKGRIFVEQGKVQANGLLSNLGNVTKGTAKAQGD